MVLRETVSSYTVSSFIASEKLEDLRNAIIMLCSQLRSLRDGGVIIRVDPAPGFSTLAKDRVLLSYGITLEVGRPRNPNKNPVAERAIEELGLEILNLSPEGGPVSQTTLSLAMANMNSCIRRDGSQPMSYGRNVTSSLVRSFQLLTARLSSVKTFPASRITCRVLSPRPMTLPKPPSSLSLLVTLFSSKVTKTS